MYPRNNASPERLAVGPVVQISDGAVQTSGVSVKVRPQGEAASAGGGTTAYEEGIVHYTPTQAETNYTSFTVIAYKSGCIPAAITVVTSAHGTAGNVYVGTNNDKTGYGLADDAITAAKFDESTAFPLKSADTGATAVLRTGADSDTGETLSDQMDALATASALATVDTVVDAIKAKTDSLTFTVAGDVDCNVQSWKGSAAADMTGDAYAVVNSGTHGNAALKTLIDAITAYFTANRAEPGQGNPAASTTFLSKIDYLYKAWRNKKTQTSSQWSLYNDAGDTVDQKATVSDNGTTTTKEEIGTGA